MEELLDRLLRFRDRRDWKKYHTPKNLALSVSIESAELLELFQWKTDAEIEVAKVVEILRMPPRTRSRTC